MVVYVGESKDLGTFEEMKKADKKGEDRIWVLISSPSSILVLLDFRLDPNKGGLRFSYLLCLWINFIISFWVLFDADVWFFLVQ